MRARLLVLLAWGFAGLGCNAILGNSDHDLASDAASGDVDATQLADSGDRDGKAGPEGGSDAKGSADAKSGADAEGGAGPNGDRDAEGGGPALADGGDDGSSPCNPSDQRCNPSAPIIQQCDLQGIWRDTTTACPYVCTGSGATTACGGSCKPGDRTCGPNNTPAQCDATGTNQPQTACAASACTGGVCAGDCVPDATRCASGSTTMVEKCDSTGHWGAATACTFVCDATANQCAGDCAPGTPNRCSSNIVQTCDATAHWVTSTTCTTTTCSGGSCRACALGEKQCNAGTPQTCNAAGAWVDDQASACPFVCNATTGTCAGECVPGSDACTTGPASKHCGANGMYGAAVTCANICDATTARCGGVCSPTAVRCNGSTAQTCGANGQWGSDTACPFGCNMTTGVCNACTDDPMSTTCTGAKCGPTANNCSHTVQCPVCSGTGQTCGGGGVTGVCGCTPETDTALCTALGKTCGSVAGTDNCGASRMAACGTCTSPLVCEPATGPAPNTCCMPETDPALCSRLGKNCNSFAATNNCGNSRTANCGSCTTPQTCGGGSTPTPNVCGCTKETDSAFCSRLGTVCGPLTGTDNCGASRSVASCGGCSSSQVCNAGQCLLAPGQLCTAHAQCGSGVCGLTGLGGMIYASGKCCNPGVPCMCPQPSSQNLLVNPGFDSSLSGWTLESGAGGDAWEPETPPDLNGILGDATSCPFSGSAYLSSPLSPSFQHLSQCVSVSPQTNYNFGVRIHTNGGAFSFCGVDLYNGAGCTGTGTNVQNSSWINVDWSPDLSFTFGTDINASARVSCYVDATTAQGAFFFDMIYLAVAPGGY